MLDLAYVSAIGTLRHLPTHREGKKSSPSANACNDVNYTWQAQTHLESCASRSLRTTISLCARRATIYPICCMCQRTQSVCIIDHHKWRSSFAAQHDTIDMGDPHAYCGALLTWTKGARNLLATIGDDDNYLQYGGTSLCRFSVLLWSFPNARNADNY